MVVAIVVAIPGATYALVSSQARSYEASALLQVQMLAGDTSLFSTEVAAPPAQAVLAAARLITTTGVAQAAAEELGEPRASARRLLRDVTATADTQAGFITIEVRARNAWRAADVANAFAAAVVTTRAAQALRRLDAAIVAVANLLGRLARSDHERRRSLSVQLQRLRALRAAQGTDARVVEAAVAPSSAASPRIARTLTLSAVVALLLAIAAAVVAHGLDRRIHDPLELEELTKRPLLSAVPRVGPGDPLSDGPAERAFGMLRAALTTCDAGISVRSVLIASPQHGDGKTTVATNLARSVARAGRDVILVDADLRRPRAASLLGVSEKAAGLADVLVGEASLEAALAQPAVDAIEGGRLRVLPGGHVPPNPSELLASRRMKALLEELSGMSDLVIVDGSPLLTVSDSLPLIGAVSGVVAVVRMDATTKDAVRRLEQVIRNAGGVLLGCVGTGAALAHSRTE